MIPGIVASQAASVASGSAGIDYHGADLILDFIDHVYRLGGIDYGAADAIDHPEYIDAVPLVETPAKSGLLIDTNNADGESSILSPFLDLAVGPFWTIVLEVDTYTADDWGCPFLMEGSGPSIDCYLLMKPAPVMYDIPAGPAVDRTVENGFDLVTGGVHTVAMTRTADRASMSVDGGAVQSVATPVGADVFTAANFGNSSGVSSGNPDNTLYVRRFLLWSTPKDDSELPTLSLL